MPVIKKQFSNDKYIITYQVDEIHDNQRLDQYILNFFSGFSRENIKNKIKSHEIKIIDRPGKMKSSTKVHTQDIIELVIHNTDHEKEYWAGEEIQLKTEPDIIFEDNDLIVISKPPYMATHPTGRHLFNCATVFFENKYQHTIHSVHRIDRETSGVLLLAKNPKTANLLTEQFEDEKVQKCYFFMAKKNNDYQNNTDFLAKERMGTTETGLKRVYINHYPENSNEGKRAETHFKILGENDTYLIGIAFPKTGRQHQIRVHAFAHGFPLIGDKLYLGSYEIFQSFKDGYATDENHKLMELNRHALHAVGIKVQYKNEAQIYLSNIPEDFRNWIEEKMDIKTAQIEEMIEKEVTNYFKSSVK